MTNYEVEIERVDKLCFNLMGVRHCMTIQEALELSQQIANEIGFQVVLEENE